MRQKENRRGEEEECTGGAKICKTMGIKKFIAMSREEKRERERQREAMQICRSTDVLFRV